RLLADADRTEQQYKQMLEAKKTPVPQDYTHQEAQARNETPTVPPPKKAGQQPTPDEGFVKKQLEKAKEAEVKRDLPVYEQRKNDLAKFVEQNPGHMTKAQIADKMGWNHVPEWEVDQLVKEGKLEQVPAGEKKFSHVDIEYRVPQNKTEIPTKVSSVAEELPADEVHSLHPSRFAQPNPQADKSSIGAESSIDKKL